MLRVNKSRLAIVVMGLLIFGAFILAAPQSRLVWNATPSYPIGLYFLDRSPDRLSVGDLVYFSGDPEHLELVRNRRYIPATGLFMKSIGALPGAEFCVEERFLVSGQDIGPVFHFDENHKALEPQKGCHVVPNDHFLPISYTDRSYDGRYTGPVEVSTIQGRLTPIYTQ